MPDWFLSCLFPYSKNTIFFKLEQLSKANRIKNRTPSLYTTDNHMNLAANFFQVKELPSLCKTLVCGRSSVQNILFGELDLDSVAILVFLFCCLGKKYFN